MSPKSKKVKPQRAKRSQRNSCFPYSVFFVSSVAHCFMCVFLTQAFHSSRGICCRCLMWFVLFLCCNFRENPFEQGSHQI